MTLMDRRMPNVFLTVDFMMVVYALVFINPANP